MAEGAAAVSMVCRPPCAVCGRPASLVELVPPGGRPHDWESWPESNRAVYLRYRDPQGWVLIFEGISGSNGLGDDISVEKATRIARAFSAPHSIAKVRTAGFYDDAGFCSPCDAAYCREHWNVSRTEYGRCPNGHGKSLDPHWSP